MPVLYRSGLRGISTALYYLDSVELNGSKHCFVNQSLGFFKKDLISV